MKRLNVPFVSKKFQKQVAGRCRVCKEPVYELLDTHRINEGGSYSYDNIVVICNSCHRKHHTGIIKIYGWHNSTMGRVLHWIDESGIEHYE